MVLLFMQLVSLPWLVLAGHGVSASTVATLPWCISEVGENVVRCSVFCHLQSARDVGTTYYSI